MLFNELQNIIREKSSSCRFEVASHDLENIIFSLSKSELLPLVAQIGSIPECIIHDSTEEKLYTKVSDIILAKCFYELNMKALVLHERANSADVFAQSKFHNYSLVADAKAFRLSRTAKNQKDFKVESLIHWKKDNNFAVLCCPYFQYPQKESQIYSSALNGNVLLFSWEYFCVLLKCNIQENSHLNLNALWNQSSLIAKNTTLDNQNKCFLETQNLEITRILNLDIRDFKNSFAEFKCDIITRGHNEINYWKEKIDTINHYSREQAIHELLSALKLNEKINTIGKYIRYLETL